MKYIFSILFILINLNANDDFYNNCQQCHGNSPGKYPLSFDQITTDFMDHEFTEYLKYDKNKSSAHNNLIEGQYYSKTLKAQMLKATSLSFETRQSITDFIFKEDLSHKCMW